MPVLDQQSRVEIITTRNITWRDVMPSLVDVPPHQKQGKRGATGGSRASQPSVQGGQAEDVDLSLSTKSEQGGQADDDVLSILCIGGRGKTGMELRQSLRRRIKGGGALDASVDEGIPAQSGRRAVPPLKLRQAQEMLVTEARLG